jgi:hypothetical protein
MQASIAAEAKQFSASQREERAATHTVVILETPAELVIKQYVNAEGKVFALSWMGPVMPDLPKLLGRYHEAFVAGAQRAPSSRNAVRIDTPEFALESLGRMRAYRGRAYVPALVPPGMRPQDIQ